MERKPEIFYTCPGCGKEYRSAKSKNETKSIWSLPVHGHLLKIIIPRHRINCKSCKYPYEPMPNSILENHNVSKQFANWIYEKCKPMNYTDLSKEIGLSDTTIRNIDKEILEKRIDKREIKKFTALGIDEIQTGHGHDYSHIITDMKNEEVLFVGDGRKSVDLAPFLLAFRKHLKDVKWIVMDMWQGYIKVFTRFCPDAGIIFDHFHITKHLNEAINKLRIIEYEKLEKKERGFIKGTKWLLLSRKSSLSRKQKSKLNSLFDANKKLLKAYLLKEEFRKLWSYQSETWARKFWQNWKRNLRWQRLEPLKGFVKMVDKHLDGIMNFYKTDDRLKMGYIEGLNNKVKTLIRKHYGFRDKKFLKMKIIQIGSRSLKEYDPYPWLSTD